MSETPTLPEDVDSRRRVVAAVPRVLALVALWCPEAPSRIGEVLLLPSSSEPRVFGRGAARIDDRHPRVLLVRQRPGMTEPTEPLELPHVSREQLLLHAHDDHLVVENVGMCALAGVPLGVSRVEVRPGDLLQLGRQLSFYCTTRPAWFPALPGDPALHPFGGRDPFGIVGESEAAWTLRMQLTLVARRQEHVLVRGDSGTGKELVAHAIHTCSARAGRPLVARNAATIPPGIADAELFGNTRNYPNAGMPERVGLVGEADGGTLFLDEFAELSHEVQAHLLRVLDGGEYHRLGEPRARRSDFRLVAATNRPLSSVKHDVLARMPHRLELTGLPARREDIVLLAIDVARRVARNDSEVARKLFPDGELRRLPRFGFDLVRALVTHDYTTHVRELEALLFRVLASGSPASDEGFGPPSTRPIAPSPPRVAPSTLPPPPNAEVDHDGAELTRARIQEVLDQHNGVLELAWRALGLSSRHALARLVKKHGVEVRRRPKP